MADHVSKKFGWVINNFSSLQTEKCYSVPFLISDFKWRLIADSKGNNGDYLSLYLQIADSESLPCGWRRYVKIRLTVVNQLTEKLSILKETEHCFDAKSITWGCPSMIPLTKLHEKNNGFLVNGEIMIFAELDCFEVISTLDDPLEKSEEASELLSMKMENDGAESNAFLKKTSQVESSVKSPLKKERLRKAFWIFIIFLVWVMFWELFHIEEKLERYVERNV